MIPNPPFCGLSKENKEPSEHTSNFASCLPPQPPEICWQRLVSKFQRSHPRPFNNYKLPTTAINLSSASIASLPISWDHARDVPPSKRKGMDDANLVEGERGDFKSTIAVKCLLGIQFPPFAFIFPPEIRVSKPTGLLCQCHSWFQPPICCLILSSMIWPRRYTWPFFWPSAW